MVDEIPDKIKKALEKRNERFKAYIAEGKRNYIEIPDLIPGYLYKIHARNARFGIWVPQRFGFLISRMKFRDNYLFEEIHYDASDMFGTARPLAEVERSPFDADTLNLIDHKREDDGDLYLAYPNSEDILEYLNNFEQDDPERQALLED